MPGPIKPPGKRINRVTKNIGTVRTAGVAPRMPSGLCKAAQTAWTSYWSDVASGVMRPSDSVVALRWVTNLDRYHRLVTEADNEPIVAGSTGQPKGNPLYDTVAKIEASIKDDERQLGIGPLNRLRLGVALSETAKTLAELNTEADDTDDPRTNLVALADRRTPTTIEPTPN